MDLKKLEDFLARENQRFVCYAAATTEVGAEKFTAQIEHQVGLSLTGDDQGVLEEQGGHMAQLVAFYTEFPSLRLYCDTNSSSSAFYLARPRKWDQLKQEFMGWVRMLHDEDSHGTLPDWLGSTLVFGEIPESSNYLLMPTEGNDAGKVFMFEHSTFTFSELGADFGSFLEKITNPNQALYEQIRRYTQYSDGETATKWLVEDYAYGA
ncbi:MAG: hypothetical protein QNI86_15215 [Halieaceae bacterium]|nr:hypothetical protein [Halieaceae bacterium]